MKEIIDKLKLLLSKDLPGIIAWNQMMPGLHPLQENYSTEGMIEASVLIALYREEGKWYFPLIQRVEDGHSHSGQVSLPGGRMDPGETSEQCAKREAFEEIGIPYELPQVLGKLTSFPIHVSNYLVHPYVAVMDHRPEWVKQTDEVAEVLEIALDQICDQSKRTEKWDLPTRGPSPVPFYYLENKKVWGATAMILAELQMILKSY